MKPTLAVVLLAVMLGSAFAQQPSNDELNNRFAILAAQRNQALDSAVVLQARVLVLEEELKRSREACKVQPPEK